jgi:serine/threonine protein phosphatase 1
MFSVGDLVDRGPKSLECLQLIEEPWFHAVRGNHEDMMLGCLGQKSYMQVTRRGWYDNGGEWAEFAKASTTLLKKCAELPLVQVVQKADGTRVNIVHAEFPDECSDDQIDAEQFEDRELSDLLWRRNRAYAAISRQLAVTNGDYDYEAPFIALDLGLSRSYMGHTPLKHTVTLGSYNFIDTGLVFGGHLTIVQL